MTPRRVQAWQLSATRALRRDDPAPAGPRVTDVRITTACYEFPVVQIVLRVADEPVDARLAVLPFRLADASDEIPHELLPADYAGCHFSTSPRGRTASGAGVRCARTSSAWAAYVWRNTCRSCPARPSTSASSARMRRTPS